MGGGGGGRDREGAKRLTFDVLKYPQYVYHKFGAGSVTMAPSRRHADCMVLTRSKSYSSHYKLSDVKSPKCVYIELVTCIRC